MERVSPPIASSRSWFSARDHIVRWTDHPLIMGIVNVTPDSFYDGGRYLTHDRAIAHGLDLIEQGADIIDIGGESTRPGAHPISVADELAHVVPVVQGLARHTQVPLSIDTTKSQVAQAALDAGASIINDVSALRHDSHMASVVAKSGAAVVLMHMQGNPQTMQRAPQYSDVVGEVVEFLEGRMATARDAGIAQTNIILDPGFGFGKLMSHNLELLRQLSTFTTLGCPVLVGLSRKAFIGTIVERSVDCREWGTAAAIALAIDRGAHIVRVHDVAMMRDVVRMTAAASPRWSSGGQEEHA